MTHTSISGGGRAFGGVSRVGGDCGFSRMLPCGLFGLHIGSRAIATRLIRRSPSVGSHAWRLIASAPRPSALLLRAAVRAFLACGRLLLWLGSNERTYQLLPLL